MTLDEAIKVLRQHNITNMSVLRITRGQALEKDLLAQVLDSCEQFISEKAEYKRLLKAAVDDFHWLADWRDKCALCGSRNFEGGCAVVRGADCDEVYTWRHETEALKLIGDESSGI